MKLSHCLSNRKEFSDFYFCFSFNRFVTKDPFVRGNKHKISEKEMNRFYQVFPAGRISGSFFSFRALLRTELKNHINFSLEEEHI